MSGPQTVFGNLLHSEKYREGDESYRDYTNRCASALKDSDDHFYAFREILAGMFFAPGGRIQAAMGATRIITAYNCFVSGTIEDSFVTGEGNIMQRATEAAATMRMGGGIGYDFSTLRPKGAIIKKLGSRSTGPISFMSIFNGLGDCTAAVGDRRGAQMGIIRIDHPDIEDFIRVKRKAGVLERFNISVGVTDEFMECLATGRPFALRFGGQTYREVDPQALWELLMRSTWDWADPGVIFIDTINKKNNLWYCETIAATNPCGEQPLPPFGACLLGSFNLTQYLRDTDGYRWFDWDRWASHIPAVVRAMDNVIDRTIYPLSQQEQEAKSKRRMGLGIMGLANAAEYLGFAYGSMDFFKFQRKVHEFMRNACYNASIDLAREKGSFPLFDADKYLTGEFIKTLPEDIRWKIAKYGIRNSHLLSIAPTGTIAQACDGVSGGIEPVIFHKAKRIMHMKDGPREVVLTDYNVWKYDLYGRTALEVSPAEHVGALIMAANYVDSAVSKTCNVPSDTSWEEFKSLYKAAWEGGAKGCTTYTHGGSKEALITEARVHPEVAEVKSCAFDPDTGVRSCE